MVAETAKAAPTLLEALDALAPEGHNRKTCVWLAGASPETLQAIRRTLARGITYTRVANEMRLQGIDVSLKGIGDHVMGRCEKCQISLKP